MRSWTAANGDKLEARFLRLDGDIVVIKSSAGRQFSISRTNLSAADNKYIETDAPIPIEDRVIGTWTGVQIQTWPAHHEIKIKRVGGRLVGEDLMWLCISREHANAAVKNRLKKQDVSRRGYVAKMIYDVKIEGDQVTLTQAKKAETIFEGEKGQDWNSELFSYVAQYKKPGILSGQYVGAKKVLKSFRFYKSGVLDVPLPLELEKGKIHLDLSPLEGGPFHYSLYIPKSYDHSKPAPVLINDSSGGHGHPLSTVAAEKWGWIMVGLKEARNGADWDISSGNCMTTLYDLRRRLNIDTKRVYFTGLSGGSRRASIRSVFYPDLCAGVICIGAGFAYDKHGAYFYPPLDKAIFFISGTNDDIVKDELIARLYPGAKKKGRACKLVTHDQGHSWGPSEQHEEAVQWMEEQWRKSKTN